MFFGSSGGGFRLTGETLAAGWVDDSVSACKLSALKSATIRKNDFMIFE
jgi:hypothetical protein